MEDVETAPLDAQQHQTEHHLSAGTCTRLISTQTLPVAHSKLVLDLPFSSYTNTDLILSGEDVPPGGHKHSEKNACLINEADFSKRH